MQVTVRIEDMNDNPPVISSTSGPTSLSLLESTPTGTILSVLSATDMDVGDNAHISYDITSGNEAGNTKVSLFVIMYIGLILSPPHRQVLYRC